MPTTLANFPAISRSGTQQTPYVQLADGVTDIHLAGSASAAVLSDTSNAITFTILASPTGSDADARVLQVEPWQGFVRTNHQGGQEPNPIDVAFGLDARRAGDKISLRAWFHDQDTQADKAIVVGATLTSLP